MELTAGQIAIFERCQPIVDRLAATQASRMSMHPIDQLPSGDSLRQYARARKALRTAGFTGEPRVVSQASTLPIDVRMQPY